MGMKRQKLDLALDLDDLEAAEIEVMAIADARGLPEMGASQANVNCCTNVQRQEAPPLEEAQEEPALEDQGPSEKAAAKVVRPPEAAEEHAEGQGPPTKWPPPERKPTDSTERKPTKWPPPERKPTKFPPPERKPTKFPPPK